MTQLIDLCGINMKLFLSHLPLLSFFWLLFSFVLWTSAVHVVSIYILYILTCKLQNVIFLYYILRQTYKHNTVYE